eukprot:1161091-Pelagomonas_calceolata.AAC.1
MGHLNAELRHCGLKSGLHKTFWEGRVKRGPGKLPVTEPLKLAKLGPSAPSLKYSLRQKFDTMAFISWTSWSGKDLAKECLDRPLTFSWVSPNHPTCSGPNQFRSFCSHSSVVAAL